jgi:hypothetical protein
MLDKDRRSPATTSVNVQQPCSNPSKTPEMLRKAQGKESVHLQAFCKLQKSPANYHTAVTRQRSLVRSQHRPLRKSDVLQQDAIFARNLVARFDPLYTNGTPTQLLKRASPQHAVDGEGNTPESAFRLFDRLRGVAVPSLG